MQLPHKIQNWKSNLPLPVPDGSGFTGETGRLAAHFFDVAPKFFNSHFALRLVSFVP